MYIDAAVANASAVTPDPTPSTTPSTPHITLDAVRAWSTRDVGDWLAAHGMARYARAFADNDIVGDVLLELTHAHLRLLDVTSLGDRIRIDRLIGQLRTSLLAPDAYSASLVSPPVIVAPYSPSPPPYAPLTATGRSGSPRSAQTPPPRTRSNPNDHLRREAVAAATAPPPSIAPGPDGGVLKKSESIMSMDYVKQNCIKVTGEKNESRVIMLPTTIPDAATIMDRILAKFNLSPESAKFSIFTSEGESTRVLHDLQLLEICRDPTRPEREKLFLRRMHTPFTFSKAPSVSSFATAPPGSGPLSASSSRGDLSAAAGGGGGAFGTPSAGSGAPPATIRQKLNMVDDYISARGAPLPVGSAKKLNKFFGERPPSELITTNLTEYFPKDGVDKIERRKSRATHHHRPTSSAPRSRKDSNHSSITAAAAPVTEAQVGGSNPAQLARVSSGLTIMTDDLDYQSTVASDLHSDEGAPFSPPIGMPPFLPLSPSAATPPPPMPYPHHPHGAATGGMVVADDGGPPPPPRATSAQGGRGSLPRSRPPPLTIVPSSPTTSTGALPPMLPAIPAMAGMMISPSLSMRDLPGMGPPMTPGTPRSLALSPVGSVFSDPPTPVSPVPPMSVAGGAGEAYTGAMMGEVDDEGPPLKWLRGALIGQGSFGSVYMGLHGITGMLMAVKQVELPADSPDTPPAVVGRKVRMVEALQHEISFLKEIRHDHIVRYLGSRIEGNFFNIFLEYVPGGSIHAVLQQWNALPEPIVKNYLRQVLLGLTYLHHHEIIHRDIKAANILVDNKGCVKISDFGISKRVGPESLVSVVSDTLRRASGEDSTADDAGDQSALDGPSKSSASNNSGGVGLSLQGSVYWMAPEVVKHLRYTRKADIWALGCLVIEMFTANHPWPNASQVEAIFKIGSDLKPEVPTDGVGPEALDFMQLTFRSNYLERPSADELLLHPFVATSSE